MAAAKELMWFLLLDEVCDDTMEHFLISDSNSDDGVLALVAHKQRKRRVRVENYAEIIVPQYSLDTFRCHFRMSRRALEFLEGLLAVLPGLPHEPKQGGRPPIPLRKQILLTLWVLGNQESLRSVADRFDVTRSSAYRVYRRICKAIAVHLSQRFIQFPSGARAREESERFEETRGFPGVMGAIDGCHIPIKAPRKNPEQYINRKGYHSIQLQVICDTSMRFTDVFCGFPGSVHDARVFRNSPFFMDAEEDPQQLFPGNTHLIEDAAYPLKSWILTPFKDNGRLTRRQRRYNFVHSPTRMVVERSLALYKGRFRKMKTEMEINRIEDAPEIVVASCVLHNICLIAEHDIDEFLENGYDDDDDDDGCGGDDEFPPEAEEDDKRNQIMRSLP